jgi:multiple sugar transport system permease protein
MKRLNFGGQVVIYFCLMAGVLLFSTPLLWMLSTALKPIDQTMTLPPSWLPYRYEVQIDDQAVSVKLGKRLEAPASIVRQSADGPRLLVLEEQIKDGLLAKPGPAARALEVLQKIPAAPKQPWFQVVPEGADFEAWSVVPVGSIDRHVSFRWRNFYDAVLAMKYFPRYLRNTLLLCFLTVLGTVCSSAMAAYGFSRIEWKGRDKVFLLALATMMIPFPVVMVPLYCLYRSLGMIGTLQPLWIGSFCAGAFNVFLLRQFFTGIPQALTDAARIDGCNELMIFWKIILPMARPSLTVVGLFQFMGTWNDFLGPLLYLTDQKDYTLALGLQFFQSRSGGTEWNYLMAASALIVLPVLVLFFFTQKSFIEGISTSGLKG